MVGLSAAGGAAVDGRGDQGADDDEQGDAAEQFDEVGAGPEHDLGDLVAEQCE